MLLDAENVMDALVRLPPRSLVVGGGRVLAVGSADEVRALAVELGHDPAAEPELPGWLHDWREQVALPSARTPLPHAWGR